MERERNRRQRHIDKATLRENEIRTQRSGLRDLHAERNSQESQPLHLPELQEAHSLNIS